MRTIFIAAAAATALAVAGCGSSDDSTSTQSAAAGTAQPAETASLDRFYKGVDFSTPTGTSAPAARKNVWIISCSQQVASCSEPASGIVEAAKALGWKTTVVDGKFSPPLWNQAIRQAVAAKADAIIPIAVDCGPTRKSLEAAKAAGVLIGSVLSIDCDDPSVGSKPLFDAPLVVNGTGKWSEQVAQWANDRAKAMIGLTKGKAKVIAFQQDSILAVKSIRQGFEKGIATCSGCKIVETVPLALTDIGPKLQQKVQSAILKHPEANVVFPLYDGLTLAGLAAGVKSSGRANDLFVMGGEGFAPDIDLMRNKGGENAAMGFPSIWAGWATVDGLNRAFDGKAPQNSGIGWQLIDDTHNLPASGPWEPPVDFRAAYRKAWGR